VSSCLRKALILLSLGQLDGRFLKKMRRGNKGLLEIFLAKIAKFAKKSVFKGEKVRKK
jgi:hypothetical protein